MFEVRLCHATHPQSQPVITEGRVESQECIFDKETQSRTGPPLDHVLQQVIFPRLSCPKTKVSGSQGPAGAHRAYDNHSMGLVLNLPFCSSLISPEIKIWPEASLQSCYLPPDCQGFLTHVGCLLSPGPVASRYFASLSGSLSPSVATCDRHRCPY